MTREEQAQLIARLANTNIMTDDFSYIVTELTESRTCENCKHGGKDMGDKIFCKKYVREHEHMITNKKTFGCNKWEAKTVSTDTKGEKDG